MRMNAGYCQSPVSLHTHPEMPSAKIQKKKKRLQNIRNIVEGKSCEDCIYNFVVLSLMLFNDRHL